jgi:hypothetical protein
MQGIGSCPLGNAHVMVKNCASLMDLFHVGLAVASCALLLYFFSRRNCSWGESFEKSGGQTFFSLKATFGRSSWDLGPCAAALLSSVGNIFVSGADRLTSDYPEFNFGVSKIIGDGSSHSAGTPQSCHAKVAPL